MSSSIVLCNKAAGPSAALRISQESPNPLIVMLTGTPLQTKGCHSRVSVLCVWAPFPPCVYMHVYTSMFQAYSSFLTELAFVCSGLGCFNQTVGHWGSSGVSKRIIVIGCQFVVGDVSGQNTCRLPKRTSKQWHQDKWVRGGTLKAGGREIH